MAKEYEPKTLIDALESMDGGVNQSRSPLKLPPDVMSYAVNVTVRNDFASHRPPYHKRPLTYENDVTKALVEGGLYQGRCFYKPDNGPECLIAAISGMLFQFQIVLNSVTVTRIDQGVTQDPSVLQAWLWQAENFVIWNDGINFPVFYDGTNCFRSNGPTTTTQNGTNTAPFVVPPINSSVQVTFDTISGMVVGTNVNFRYVGNFLVQAIPPTDGLTGTTVLLVNLDVYVAPGTTETITSGTASWTATIARNQLPPGRMGVYGMGRNWVCLTDGRSFIASDCVGGSSGTAPLFRDAVLYVTENAYLAGGGAFILPGSVGDIQAMIFTATLDVSMGQGPLQIFTPTCVFSVYTPTDRTTWGAVTNPILTQSLVTNGGKGQNSTVNASGDILFRAIDGIRSLILGRRDFDTWGNSPISNEIDDILSLDDPGLLRYGSAMVFDNRLLMTTHPIQHAQGIYWMGLIPLNFDPVSTLRGKLPSVYDSGIWTGFNCLQLVIGQFNDVERGFAFVLNTTTGATRIELWEIMKTGSYDNDGVHNIPIIWRFRSAALKFGQTDPKTRQLLKMQDGEIYVQDLIGTCKFNVQLWPDQYPCPLPWFSWSECQTADASDSQPGFRPRMGLGEPSGVPCDVSNNRPLREFYTAIIDVTVQGSCTFLGGRFKAVTQPQPEFAKQNCGTNVKPFVPYLPPNLLTDSQGNVIISGGGGITVNP